MIAGVVGAGCCCGCCSVLAGAPDYIDVEISFTHASTARICNPDFGSAWATGDIVFETSASGSLKTRLKKVLAEGCWTYACPPEDDENRLFSVTFSASETHYLACLVPFTFEYWYGETYNDSWTYSAIDQPGCIAFAVTLNSVESGCELCVTLAHTAESGAVHEWECGECGSPGLDSGSEASAPPFFGGSFTLTACRVFSGVGTFEGPMTTCESGYSVECPCPQSDCEGACFQAEYSGAIKTCMSVAAHDVVLCNSHSCAGSIAAVP